MYRQAPLRCLLGLVLVRPTKHPPSVSRGICLLAPVFGLLVASPLRGQTHPPPTVRVAASPTANTVLGEDFAHLNPGVGIAGGLRFPLSPRLEVGVDGWLSSHKGDGLSENLTFSGLSGGLRYYFASRQSELRPFAGGRVGTVRWSGVDQEAGVRAEASATGFAAGALAGVEFPFGRRGAVGIVLNLSAVSFSEASLTAVSDGRRLTSDSLQPGSETTGGLLGMLAEVTVGLF